MLRLQENQGGDKGDKGDRGHPTEKREHLSISTASSHSFSGSGAGRELQEGAARLNLCCAEQFRARSRQRCWPGAGGGSGDSSVNAHPIDSLGSAEARGRNLISWCQQRSDVAQGKGVLKDFSQEGPKGWDARDKRQF